jgi:cold shock CspA family protein
MSRAQLTFKKKERAKKQQQKKQEKLLRREQNKQTNDKGKSLEELFAYVDEFKEEDLQRPADPTEEFHYGKVSYYNETGHYGFIRDNETRETVYFNDKIVGVVLNVDQKVKYKYTRTKQGNQVSEIELNF